MQTKHKSEDLTVGISETAAIAYCLETEAKWYPMCEGDDLDRVELVSAAKMDDGELVFWRVVTKMNKWDVWMDASRGLYGEC